MLLVDQLRLAQHQTHDQIHQALQERLTPLGLTISHREVLYLFEAYCTLVRASQQIAKDHAWHAQVRANGGLILSIDGIQPDKGNETVYLVRDILTGRVLLAENVRTSETPPPQRHSCRSWTITRWLSRQPSIWMANNPFAMPVWRWMTP